MPQFGPQPETHAEERRLLLARRSELTRRLTDIESELDRPGNPDDEDRALESEGDEVLEDLGLSGEREIAAIDAALGRIADGTYGICRGCETPISPARLKAVPTTDLCRACARG